MSRPGPKTRPLTISDKERMALEEIADQSDGSPQAAKRARIVLLCAEGDSNSAIARQVGTNAYTVRKWRNQYIEPAPEEERESLPRRLRTQPRLARRDRTRAAGGHHAGAPPHTAHQGARAGAPASVAGLGGVDVEDFPRGQGFLSALRGTHATPHRRHATGDDARGQGDRAGCCPRTAG